ncbi:MAG: SPOR domain-containing protein [Rhodospirillaceae bacterium]|jgi:hypothetical protein|nr:SPOR domain-containing protein [Rhodospirillaceae bacterium]
MSEGTERPTRPPMIDDEDRPGPPPLLSEEPQRSGRGLTIFIAVFALLTFAGVVWYAYDQGRQAGSEATAPIIRANANPSKVRPEQPGGMKIPHQNIKVYESGTERSGTSKVERLMPPPESPLPPAKLTAPPASAGSSAIPPATRKSSAESLIKPAPPPPPVTAAGTVAKKSAEEPKSVVPKTVAPPPAPQPVKSEAKAPPAPKPVAAKAVPKKAAPKTITPPAKGRFRIQLAALKSEDRARALWTRTQGRNKDLLGGLTLTIEAITVATKGRFYRVQGGSVAEADARRICAVLKTRNQACLVVRR